MSLWAPSPFALASLTSGPKPQVPLPYMSWPRSLASLWRIILALDRRVHHTVIYRIVMDTIICNFLFLDNISSWLLTVVSITPSSIVSLTSSLCRPPS